MNKFNTFVCRLCLKESEVKFSLFTANITNQIEALTAIKIKKDDKLPQTCCEACMANIYTSFKFQQCVIESDRVLRERLSHQESQIIEHAKQTTDLFEILHVDVSPNIAISDAIESPHCKLENVDEFENNSSSYGEIFESFLEDTKSTNNSCSSLCNKTAVEYKNVNNVTETAVLLNLSDAGDSLCKVDVVKQHNQNQLEITTNSHRKDVNINNDLNIKNKLSQSTSKDSLSTVYTTENVLSKLGIQKTFVERLVRYQQNQNITQIPWECVDCNMKFPSKRMLYGHNMKHKIDICPFCSIPMRSDNLKKHMQIHTDSPEICEICGKLLKNKESLRGHINYHHKTTTTIKCEFCNREFKTGHHHSTHIKKIHLGIKNHQCHICGKKFFASTDLNKHINMTHRGARPYVCQYCKKGFSSLYARKTHIRQHTLETPYRCEVCAAGFRQKVSLVTHLKSKHSIVNKNKTDVMK